jgi:hypothetical protein
VKVEKEQKAAENYSIRTFVISTFSQMLIFHVKDARMCRYLS